MTSQQAIEDAMRKKGVDATTGESYTAEIVLKIEGLDLEHRVNGTISGRSE